MIYSVSYMATADDNGCCLSFFSLEAAQSCRKELIADGCYYVVNQMPILNCITYGFSVGDEVWRVYFTRDTHFENKWSLDVDNSNMEKYHFDFSEIYRPSTEYAKVVIKSILDLKAEGIKQKENSAAPPHFPRV